MAGLDPDPFNHGTTAVRLTPAPEQVQVRVKQLVESNWAIGEVNSVHAYSHSPELHTSNLVIDSNAGRYHLSLSDLHSADYQSAIFECLKHLSTRQIPTPIPLPTRSEELVVESQGRLCHLSEFVPGEHFDGSRERLKLAGQALAQLHQALASFSKPERFAREVYPFDLQALEQAKALVSKDSQTARALESLPLDLEFPHELPKILGHFDFHPHNLLFALGEPEICSILDFDLMRVGERARDVALAMHKFARIYGTRTERQQDCGASLAVRARLFLDAYQETIPLTQKEIESIPNLLKDECRRKILYLAKQEIQGLCRSQELEKQRVQMAEARLFYELSGGPN